MKKRIMRGDMAWLILIVALMLVLVFVIGMLTASQVFGTGHVIVALNSSVSGSIFSLFIFDICGIYF